jgi:hypothetical protein
MNPNFQNNATAAESFRRLSQEPDEQEFWAGYVRGLRRNHHGEKFETEAEHSLWMSAADSSDQSRKMRGLGYRAGFEGQNVQAAMKTLVGYQHMSELGKLGGSATSERKTASSRANAKLGGRPRKTGEDKNG